MLWSDFHLLTREHFYHVGAKEDNRNPMTEALLTNFNVTTYEASKEEMEQLAFLEISTRYENTPDLFSNFDD